MNKFTRYQLKHRTGHYHVPNVKNILSQFVSDLDWYFNNMAFWDDSDNESDLGFYLIMESADKPLSSPSKLDSVISLVFSMELV